MILPLTRIEGAMKKETFHEEWIYREGGGCALEVLSKGIPGEKKITLPHDASIERPRIKDDMSYCGNGYFEPVNCHYIKEFYIHEDDKDKVVWIEFEGVYQNAFVYVNSSYAGKCFYGYSNFYLDITDFIRFGEKNQIKVIVKNGISSGRWYTGTGIYRNVNLMIADRLHLLPDQVHYTTLEAEEDLAVIEAEASVEYTGCGVKDAEICFEVFEERGGCAACVKMPVTLKEHSKEKFRQRLYIEEPRIWDPDHPILYQYRVTISARDMTDTEEGSFGIRTLRLDRKHGLRLNGRSIKLRGGCIHHDHGILGTASFYAAEERRIKKLKQAGYNCIRSAHHPADRELLTACDRLGMLVMDEFSDVWTMSKVDYDYGMHMTECWEEDIERMVNKDYNHPSVILYSIGNEIIETGNRLDVRYGKKIADKIRELDRSRYTVNCINLVLSVSERMEELKKRIQEGKEQIEGTFSFPEGTFEINDFMSNQAELSELLKESDFAGEATEQAFSQVDIAGYNYGVCRYEKDGQKYPNRIIVGSETYPADLDRNWELVKNRDHVIGDFSWTAWDYLGEAGIGRGWYGDSEDSGFYASYPWKMGNCGDFDILGARRPVSYWREIIWGMRQNPYIAVHDPQYYGKENHTTEWGFTNAVHRWNWKGFERKNISLEVYSPGDEVELFVNGKSIGKKKTGEEKQAITKFETVYIPGRIEAVAYIEGKETGRHVLETADDEVGMRLYTDRTELQAGGKDVCLIEASICDMQGRLNMEAARQISVTVEGNGVLQGIGSANPVSEENFSGNTAWTFEGRVMAAVRTIKSKGKIYVRFRADGCEDQKICLYSR